MKKLLLIFFIFLTCFSINGQDVIVSDPIPIQSDFHLGIIGEIAGQPLIFRWKDHDYRIIGFNENLQKKFEKKIELAKRLPNVLYVEVGKNDFSIIYHHRFKGHSLLSAHKYDVDANLLDTVLIADLGRIVFTPRFRVVESEDKNNLLVYFFLNEEVAHAYCYQLDSMKLLWKKKFLPENYFREQSFFQAEVSNAGEMFMIFKRDNINTKRRPHRFTVVSYKKGMEDVFRSNIFMQGHSTYDAVFKYDNLNHQLVGGGFYSEKNLARASGWFYLRWKANDTTRTLLKFHELDSKLIADFMNRKKIRKNRSIADFEMREPVLRRDGGILLLAERVTVYNQQHIDRMRRISRFDYPTRRNIGYYYEEVLLLSIHPDGRLHWSNVLRKKQISHGDEGAASSYFLAKTHRRIRLVFNREIERNTLITEYIYKGDGSFSENNIISTEDLNAIFRFKEAIQVSKNVVLVWSHWHNRLRLARFEYK